MDYTGKLSPPLLPDNYFLFDVLEGLPPMVTILTFKGNNPRDDFPPF